MQTRLEKINKVVYERQEGVLVLEDIHDIHNAAAMWRTADAFGWQKIVLIFEKEKAFNPKREGKKSSGGTNKWLDFELFRSTRDCLTTLKERGYEIWATVVDDRANTVYESDFTKRKLAIMWGNEHRGLSETAVKMADRKIYIPMKGMVQSLNLSVTGGILLFEIERQRKRAGKDKYFLSQEERDKLVENWGAKKC